jgi:hypothetical protein
MQNKYLNIFSIVISGVYLQSFKIDNGCYHRPSEAVELSNASSGVTLERAGWLLPLDALVFLSSSLLRSYSFFCKGRGEE